MTPTPWSWRPILYEVRCIERKAQLAADLGNFVSYCRTQRNVVRVIAFGSFARDRVTPWSDLDLLVVRDGDGLPPLIVDDLHVHGPAVSADLVGIRADDFSQRLRDSPFGIDILRDGIEVCARPAG